MRPCPSKLVRAVPRRRRRAPLGATALAIGLCVMPSFGGEEAPPSPFKPWYPPELKAYEKELAQSAAAQTPGTAEIAIDSEKIYDLPELVDIAERTNPQTRSAWE